jgi:hypothetical protein
MKFLIPFLAWTGRASLEVEIPDSTEERFRLKVALEIAVRDRASLDGASLVGASLVRASLVGARLDRASLVGASLVGASLDGASLVGASLDRASLDKAQLRTYRADLFDILLRAPREVEGLLKAVREGRINGSTYEGECACLVGTIANVRGCSVDTIDYRDSSRPAEQWFMLISPGQTPENHEPSKLVEQWIMEFQALTAPVLASDTAS